jgi:peroxiredoxin
MATFTARKLAVVAISVDAQSRSATLADKLALSFPLLSDPRRVAISAWGVAAADSKLAVPATFLVARDGRLLYRHVGTTMTDRPGIIELRRVLDRPR